MPGNTDKDLHTHRLIDFLSSAFWLETQQLEIPGRQRVGHASHRGEEILHRTVEAELLVLDGHRISVPATRTPTLLAIRLPRQDVLVPRLRERERERARERIPDVAPASRGSADPPAPFTGAFTFTFTGFRTKRRAVGSP